MDTRRQGVDEGRLERVLGQVVTDMGAAMNGVLMLVGGELGLWRAMAGAGPLTAADLARRSGVRERYVQEWLAGQAASGYVQYDPAAETFTLLPEEAMAFADEDSPVYVLGGYHVVSAAYKDWSKLAERLRGGEGLGWHEHDPELFEGTERFFRPGYRAHLVAEWIPALEEVEGKLHRGALVADVGCGHGVSTVLMARAFPGSTIRGFDYHPESIARATELARAEGVDANAAFAVASAKDFPGRGYDLVCFFDCLHDMGDPVGALRHVREALAEDGTVMLVEPFAADSLSANLNPVGRIYYAASTVICLPLPLSKRSSHAAPLTGLPSRASRFLAACPGSPGLTAALRFTKAPTEPTGGAPTKLALWGAPGERYLARLMAALSSR